MSFTSDTLCALVVQADSAEAALPGQWRLLWVADSSGVTVVAVDSVLSCQTDTAKVSSIDPPSTAADSASNQVTTHFCSAGSNAATTAFFALELTGGSTGKLKLVALDPNDPDSSAVIQSGEVTFNGGIDGSYPMAVLHMKSDHASHQFKIDAVGSGLDAAQAVTVATATFPDIRLAITSRSDSALSAAVNIPTALPAASVRVVGAEGSVASKTIPADPLVESELPDSAVFVDPDSTIYPKDFTLFYASTPLGGGVWQTLFHIFYIRACRPDSCADPDTSEQWFGHAWSPDLVDWTTDIYAFHVSDNAEHWDARKIYAPSIVLNGTTFYMFYTGVDAADNQTIGFASTDNLDLPDHWQRQPEPVLTTAGTDWIHEVQPSQLRDPFVMPDPASPLSRYLMFFTAQERTRYGVPPDTFYANAVGVARSAANDVSDWTHLGYYPSTDYAHTAARNLESPHVFPDAGHVPGSEADQAYWRIMYTDGAWTDWTRAILFTTKRADDFSTPLTDLDPGHWSAQPTALYPYLHLTTGSVEYGHQASEVMRFGNAWYWGAYDGTDLRFRKLVWEPDSINFHLENVDVLDVGRGGAGEVLRLSLVELVPGRGRAKFRVDLHGETMGSVKIFDVMGRRIRTLMDGKLSAGVSTVSWDGHDGHGIAVGSGVYFARLTAGGRSDVLRVPLIR